MPYTTENTFFQQLGGPLLKKFFWASCHFTLTLAVLRAEMDRLARQLPEYETGKHISKSNPTTKRGSPHLRKKRSEGKPYFVQVGDFTNRRADIARSAMEARNFTKSVESLT